MLPVIEMPALSSTMKKGKVVKWCKKEGDFAGKGEILYELETDKINLEVEALNSGFLRKIILAKSIEAPVKTPISILSSGMDEDISSLDEAEPPAMVFRVKGKSDRRAIETPRPKISPFERRIAEGEGVDIQTITGTDPSGRITKKDVERAVMERSQAPVELEAKPEPHRKITAYEDIELTKMRSVIAKRLQENKVTAPHYYVDVTADASAITHVKENLESRVEKHGAKISFNDILIKIVSRALKEFPMVNARFLRDRIRV